MGKMTKAEAIKLIYIGNVVFFVENESEKVQKIVIKNVLVNDDNELRINSYHNTYEKIRGFTLDDNGNLNNLDLRFEDKGRLFFEEKEAMILVNKNIIKNNIKSINKNTEATIACRTSIMVATHNLSVLE